jgi:hypothetical protein
VYCARLLTAFAAGKAPKAWITSTVTSESRSVLAARTAPRPGRVQVCFGRSQ